jgi:hypothetical protein
MDFFYDKIKGWLNLETDLLSLEYFIVIYRILKQYVVLDVTLGV